MPKQSEKELTAQQIADRWGISKRTVIRMIHQGEFPNARQLANLGPRAPFVVPLSDVEALEKEKRQAVIGSVQGT